MTEAAPRGRHFSCKLDGTARGVYLPTTRSTDGPLHCRVTDSGHDARTSPRTEEDAEKRPSSGYGKPRQPDASDLRAATSVVDRYASRTKMQTSCRMIDVECRRKCACCATADCGDRTAGRMRTCGCALAALQPATARHRRTLAIDRESLRFDCTTCFDADTLTSCRSALVQLCTICSEVSRLG